MFCLSPLTEKRIVNNSNNNVLVTKLSITSFGLQLHLLTGRTGTRVSVTVVIDYFDIYDFP